MWHGQKLDFLLSRLSSADPSLDWGLKEWWLELVGGRFSPTVRLPWTSLQNTWPIYRAMHWMNRSFFLAYNLLCRFLHWMNLVLLPDSMDTLLSWNADARWMVYMWMFDLIRCMHALIQCVYYLVFPPPVLGIWDGAVLDSRAPASKVGLHSPYWVDGMYTHHV